MRASCIGGPTGVGQWLQFGCARRPHPVTGPGAPGGPGGSGHCRGLGPGRTRQRRSRPAGSAVRFAVDATPDVVAEAVADGIDLLVTHHPLLLRGVSSIAETSSRGRSLAQLVRAGCALFTMHTNADQAADGVNDALADALGIDAQERRPIRPLVAPGPVRLVTYVPEVHADALVTALATVGAGRLGDYDSCAYWTDGTGQFRPREGAHPHMALSRS